MAETYLTREEAEEITMAVEVGIYNIEAPGACSKLAQARLLLSSQQANSGDPISGKLNIQSRANEEVSFWKEIENVY